MLIADEDRSKEFAATTRGWLEKYEENRAELERLLGEETVEERQADRRALLRATEDGVLRRALLTAEKAGAG
jgi:hypothetical protein